MIVIMIFYGCLLLIAANWSPKNNSDNPWIHENNNDGNDYGNDFMIFMTYGIIH